MADASERKGGWTQKLSRTARVGGIILVSLATAFGVLLLVNSQAIVGSSHDRNAHDLEITANAIANWPRTFDQAARLQYGEKARIQEKDDPRRSSITIPHPDLGPIKIVYWDCPPEAENSPATPGQLFPSGQRAGEGPVFALAGQFRYDPAKQPPPPAASTPAAPKAADAANKDKSPVAGTGAPRDICYSTQVDMARLVGLDRTNELSNIVLVGADEAVLVQFGSPSLPITKVPPLAAANSFAKELAAGLTLQTAKEEQRVALATTTGATRTRVGDLDYYVYVQPLQVDAPASQCPPAPGGQGTEGGAERSAPGSAVARPCQLYALGFMPTDTMRRAWFRPPPLILLGFGLALLIALALLPAMRLLMIGGTESVSAAEMGAIAFGTFAATSVAALAALFAIEVAGERALARSEAHAEAKELASRASGELERFRLAAEACTGVISNAAQLDAVRIAPAIQTAGFVIQKGTPESDVRPWCAGERLPPQSDVSARQYFQSLLAKPASADGGGPASGPKASDHVFGQVSSQSDGINKSVVVIRLPGTNQPDSPTARYFLATTVLRPLVSPVLPPPQDFMVVDTSDPLLPVIFHRNPARIGVDTFASQVQNPSEVVAALDRLPGQPKDGPLDFVRRFEGEITHFSAAGIEGSEWVVLVYHRLDDADVIAAQTATRALAGWASITLPAMVACVVLLLFFPGAWRYLWPFKDGVAVYRATIPRLWIGALFIAIMAVVVFSPQPSTAVAPAIVGALFVLFCLHHGAWRYPWPIREGVTVRDAATWWLRVGGMPIAIVVMVEFSRQPLAAVAIATGGAWLVYFRLRGKELNAKPLTVADERSYRRFVLAVLAFIAVAPMIAFWADARSLSRELADVRRQEHAVAAIDERFQQIGALKTVLTRPELTVDGQEIDLGPPWPGDRINPWGPPVDRGRIERLSPGGFSRLLMTWQSPLAFAPINRCRFDGEGGTAGGARAADAEPWYCWKHSANGAAEIGVAQRPAAIPRGAAVIGLIAVVALGLTALIYAVVYFGLWALTGFGIPLGAVVWPKLVLHGDAKRAENELPLAAKSLLVAPQQAVRDEVSSGAQIVNVADELLPRSDKELCPDGATPINLLPAWDGQPSRLVVSGLELVLRDPERRSVALAYLERAAAIASDSRGTRRRELVVIAEMSPLERILDAFDSFGKDHALDADVREELRWARLFQDFTTFSFAPIDKVDRDEVRAAFPNPGSTERILVDELRWLPGNVIDGVIVPALSMREEIEAGKNEALKIGEADAGRFPLPERVYQGFYTQKIIAWARSARAITPEAAVDYMRANLIEFYEQCWVASSLSERVILDAIARNSYVNMRKAVALQSLVRRGLVILDPAPRLMNRSFALYIRQAERPDTLEKWRKQQPRSPWSLARLPLAIVLPVLIIGVTMAAAESGQEVAALVSLLAAGMPALIGSVVRTARGSS